MLRLSAIKIFCLMLGLAVGLLLTSNRLSVIVNNTVQASYMPTIIIDAGHGGFDGGATGSKGVIEKDINLAISAMLQEYCELYGLEVIMTRQTDTDIGENPTDSLSARKKSDMKNRLKTTIDNPNSVFVSIHQNKFPESKYWGGQVFYGIQNEQSLELAQIIQKNIREMVQPQNAREIKKATKDLYLLYYSKVPSVIIECGFLSNDEEAIKLQDKAYQQQIAHAIFTSIVEYLY